MNMQSQGYGTTGETIGTQLVEKKPPHSLQKRFLNISRMTVRPRSMPIYGQKQ